MSLLRQSAHTGLLLKSVRSSLLPQKVQLMAYFLMTIALGEELDGIVGVQIILGAQGFGDDDAPQLIDFT